MCDFNEYSIVAPEHCVFVPKLSHTQEQLNLLADLLNPNRHVIGFQTQQITWEFTITYYAKSYYIKSIGIKNIHGPVNESEANEPFAEILIWRWNGYHQEIIKKEMSKRNENKRDISLRQDAYEVYIIVRLIGKRKPARELCPPSEFLDSSDAFTISVGDQNFVVSAHRLMQISPVFRAMLSNEMREKAQRKVEVKDTEPEHFRAFLEVIDPDQNIYPNPINVIGVLKLADYYEVNFAKERCEAHLLICVEMPLIERLQLADTYELNKLKHSILSIGSSKLRAFYLSNSDQLQEEGRFSKKLMDKLTLRLCCNE